MKIAPPQTGEKLVQKDPQAAVVRCVTLVKLTVLALVFVSLATGGSEIRMPPTLLVLIWAVVMLFAGQAVWTSLLSLRSTHTRQLTLLQLFVDVAFIVVLYGIVMAGAGIRTPAGIIGHDWSSGLYLSAMTLTTVGYGDFTPATRLARFFASAEALTGYFMLALIIANLIERAKDQHLSR